MKEKTTTELLSNLETDLRWVDEKLRRHQHPRMLRVKQQLLEKKKSLQIKSILDVI